MSPPPSASLARIEAAKSRYTPPTYDHIVLQAVGVGSVTGAIESLGMAVKLDPRRPTARMAIEPWLVEAAFCVIGIHRLAGLRVSIACRRRLDRLLEFDLAVVRSGKRGSYDSRAGYPRRSEELAATEVEVDCFVLMLGQGGEFCAPYQPGRPYRNLTTFRQTGIRPTFFLTSSASLSRPRARRRRCAGRNGGVNVPRIFAPKAAQKSKKLAPERTGIPRQTERY